MGMAAPLLARRSGYWADWAAGCAACEEGFRFGRNCVTGRRLRRGALVAERGAGMAAASEKGPLTFSSSARRCCSFFRLLTRR